PGNDLQHAAVIRWTAPADMVVSVNGTLKHEHEQGDGVRGQIFAAGRRIAGPFILHQDSVATHVESISLAQGETLDFIVDIHGGLSYDSFAWSPTIVELPAARSATAPESAVDVKSTAIADSSPPKSWNYS